VIALVLSMIVARRVQALTVALLSVLAVAAAVGAPVYLRAVDRAVVATEVDRATADELTVAFTSSDERTVELAAALLRLPGFTTIHAARIPVLGTQPGVSWLVAQQEVCAHLAMTAGRCLMGPSEVIVGSRTAQRLELRPGATIDVTPATYDPQSNSYVPEPGRTPATLSVVGVYRPVDPREPYWGRSPHFRPGPADPLNEPFFTAPPTLPLIPHGFEIRVISAVAEPGAITVDRLGPLRTSLTEVAGQLRVGLEDGSFGSDLDTLFGRIDRGRELARQVVPIAAVPMVVLCWFVLFLAVAYGTHARRHELGLVALRGARAPVRWWLTAGESALVILAGAPVGYLLGHACVRVAAALRLDSTDGTGLSLGPFWYAAIAVAGALLAGTLAQRQALASPVVELLRRVPGPGAAWRSVAFDVAAVVVTAVAIVQLRTPGGQLAGVSLLVPALVAATLAVVLSRLLRPLAGRFGRYALRRGRLGTALGALQLARHPGSQRLFVLLSVVLAGLGFAAGATDVAGRAIVDRALVSTGAPRVISLSTVDSGRLLHAVRRIDPDGRFAMAVAVLPGGGAEPAPRLAVDTARLAAVAEWRPDFGSVGSADLAARLHPPAPEPLLVEAATLAVDLAVLSATVDVDAPAEGPPRAYAVLRPVAGGPPVVGVLGDLVPGRRTYRADVACASGCRLTGLEIRYPSTAWHHLELQVHDISTVDISDADRWRGDSGALLASGGGVGLRFSASNLGRYLTSWLLVADSPSPVPVAATFELPRSFKIGGLDGVTRTSTQVGQPELLPGLGNRGIVMDLEYADRAAVGGTALAEPQFWLGRQAPADVLDRLAAEGLVVVGDLRVEDRQAALDRDAPAVALWFHLVAAGFGVMLALGGIALVAVVDRAHRLADLRALRAQGLSRRTVGTAARWGQLSVVAAAVPCGVVAALAAWAAVGDALPLVEDAALAAPEWPAALAMAGPWAAAAVGFAVVATAAGAVLARAAGRSEKEGRR